MVQRTLSSRRDLAIGALVYALVSAVWVGITYFVGEANGAVLLAVAVPLLAALVITAGWTLNHIDDNPPAVSQTSPSIGKWLGLIFAAEGIGIGVSSGLLASMGLIEWIPPVVAVIVGLHFLPLGRLLRLSFDYFLGAAIILFVLAAILFVPANQWATVVGSGTALMLWLAGWGRLWVGSKQQAHLTIYKR